jgi:hypothetical protein
MRYSVFSRKFRLRPYAAHSRGEPGTAPHSDRRGVPSITGADMSGPLPLCTFDITVAVTVTLIVGGPIHAGLVNRV